MKKTLKNFLACVMMISVIITCMPSGLFAADAMSDEFKAALNENGKFEMYSIVPKSEEDVIQLFWENEDMNEKYPDLWFDEFSSDYKSCVLTNYALEESHTVEIEYIYDEDMITEVADIIKKIPLGEYNEELDEYDPYPFEVKDMELINYWVNGGGINDLISYSNEFKEVIGYKNFRIDCRRGEDAPFYTEAYGFAPFKHNGTIYGFSDMGVKAKHAIFVPDETGDTPDELKEAVLKRIEEYIGTGKVEVTGYDTDPLSIMLEGYDETIEYAEGMVADVEGYIAETEALIAEYEARYDEDPQYYAELINQCNVTLQDYQNSLAQNEAWVENAKKAKQEYIDEYNTVGGENYYLNEAAGDYYFTLKIGEEEYSVVVIKDSERMITPEYKSADVKTGITVDSTDTSIPLDTLISVEELVDGDIYENIMTILDVEESKSFDINLFSGSLDKYITKLANGEFKVAIPLSEEFDGKDLMVYYVDENDKVVEYKVEIDENDFAVFNTNHFSIYTLAIVGEGDNVEDTTDDTTPDTGDSVNVWFLYGMLAMSTALMYYARKKEFAK